jgi:hypothetical protein
MKKLLLITHGHVFRLLLGDDSVTAPPDNERAA